MIQYVNLFFIVLLIFSCKKEDKSKIQLENLRKESYNTSLKHQAHIIELSSKFMERTVTIEERDSIDKEKYTVLGTGFFINNEGHILTCYHVVRNKTKVWINLGGTQKHLQAKVIGDDYKYDLALLKAEFEDPIPTKIPHITIPYEEFPARGTEYISFGASHGRRDTLIKGYVANIVNKGIADDRPEEYYLQLSEPVLSGSSGGPVIDLSGKLIGMNRFTYSLGGKGTFGPGFAIPTDILYNFVKNQKEVVSVKTKAMRGIIEIPFTTMYLVKKLNLPDMAGVIVSYPEKDSAAEKAGIKRYDYITHLNGKQIHGFFEFFEDMKKIDKKEDITFSIIREGKKLEITIKGEKE